MIFCAVEEFGYRIRGIRTGLDLNLRLLRPETTLREAV
ncbi:hypothetical protein V6Z12_A07G070500 [Gossypium hirsutum]